MSENVIIYGNGSMAHILFSYAKEKMNICGFTVDDNCIKNHETEFCNRPLIPFSTIENIYNPSDYKMIVAVGFIEMNELRERKYQELKNKGYSFVSYIDNTVKIHDEVEIEENCIILDFVSIHPGTKIKQGTFISSNVNIGHSCCIESSNWINSGVSIAGGSTIGSACFFGVNSSVGHGVTLGERNFIAANTFICKSTKDDEVYISESGTLSRLKSKFFLKFSRVLG